VSITRPKNTDFERKRNVKKIDYTDSQGVSFEKFIILRRRGGRTLKKKEGALLPGSLLRKVHLERTKGGFITKTRKGGIGAGDTEPNRRKLGSACEEAGFNF